MLQIFRFRPLYRVRTLQCLFSTAINRSQNIKAIKMAYAFYESNQSPTGAPPLIVMHGMFGSKANWNSLCKQYQRKTVPPRKIFAVDARNHGDSPHADQHTYEHLAEDIKALYEEQRIDRACLLGHSMGGRAVMYFALTNPGLVQKIIIADTSPVYTGAAVQSFLGLLDFLVKVKMPTDGSMSAARLAIDKQLAERIDDKGLRSFLMTNIVPDLSGGYKWRINLPALAKNFHHIASFPNVNEHVFTGPVIFIGGVNSDYLPKDDHAQILKMFPQATFTYIDGAGHWLHHEKPNEFLKLTLDFLNKD